MKRTLLSLSLTLATTLMVAGASAQTSAPVRVDHVQPGYHHVKIGAVDVIALSDGTLPIPAARLLLNITPFEVAARLAQTFQGHDVDTPVNAFLMKIGDRLIMIDAGTGELYGPNLNKLTASLRNAGYPPEAVTDILITHIHTDHTGGLMDGSRMVFPNATLHIAQQEVDYWLSPEQRARAPEAAKKYFDEATAKVKPYVDAGKVKTFSGATQLFPGLGAAPAPGHTPGHTFYILESAGAKVVFIGDLLHVPDVQLARPDVTIAFDVNPAMAAITRKRALADALAGRYWLAGDHMAFPGIGHIQTDHQGYRWIPAPYINDYYEAK